VANRLVNASIMISIIVVLAVVAGRRHVKAQDAPRAVFEGTHGAPHALGSAASTPTGSTPPTTPSAGPGAALLSASAAALSGGWRAGFWLAVGCGVLDAAANAIVLLGLRIGDLTVVSVLTALYPAGTILLAAIVLRERIAPVQWVGLVLALTASAMLSLA
jgi:drug/metabolite transporter (DMT)-like permease